MKFESINPFTEEKINSFEFIENEQIDSIINQLQNDYCKYKLLGINDRRILVKQFLDELVKEKETLSNLITIETAKPIQQSRAEIDKCIYTCNYYLNEIPTYLTPTKLNDKAYIQYDSLGIIFGIMPWNFPIWQVIRFAIPTILAGNVVLIKHAPNTPLCSLFLYKLFNKIQSTNSIYKQLFIDLNQIEYVISKPEIMGVSLTGSTEAGRSVAQICSKYLKKYVLELGGSDPFIVCKDAQINNAVNAAVESRCRNNGQSCIAAKRFIIHENCYDEFIQQLKQQLDKLVHSFPENEEAYITSLARGDLKLKLENQINSLVNFGFTCIYKKSLPVNSKNTVLPHIYECNEQSLFKEYNEELFAPIFLVYKFSSNEDALNIANNTKYGLAASVWTADVNTSKWFEDNIQSGMVYVNEIVMSDASMPFGGIKNSGIGKELGILGIKEFMNSKLIYKQK